MLKISEKMKRALVEKTVRFNSAFRLEPDIQPDKNAHTEPSDSRELSVKANHLFFLEFEMNIC